MLRESYPINPVWGPTVDLIVDLGSLQNAIRNALSGQAGPRSVSIRALIDTGAAFTRLDQATIDALDSTAHGSTPVHASSQNEAASDAPCHELTLVLTIADRAVRFPDVTVAEMQCHPGGVQGVIGRDILRHLVFIYDGQSGRFTLESKVDPV